MSFLYYALGFVGYVCAFNLASRALDSGYSKQKFLWLIVVLLAITSKECFDATNFMHFWLWVATYIIASGVHFYRFK